MMNLSSTLVETVSINYEDFNESFLTCGTCLCMFDGGEHIPKLLPCSHTICLECLTRIVATFARDSQFRCPICRELINIPQGGVAALPPSFLVNQLLDLMARQRRDVVPRCSTHPNQELLFCETCDSVFCSLCTGGGTGSHVPSDGIGDNDTPTAGDHTVIPFSIAMKRMSEILLYKANECIAKLNTANEVMMEEIHMLDHNADNSFTAVNKLFEEVAEEVEQRRIQVLSEVKGKKDEKKHVLEEQLKIIAAEKTEVEEEVDALQQQLEVRNITKKISELNTKLDTISQLTEPRENCYIEFCRVGDKNRYKESVSKMLCDVGQIKTSQTLPSLCRVTMETATVHLATTAWLQTMNYQGEMQKEGGDPVSASVTSPTGKVLEGKLEDKEDGSYKIEFTPNTPGNYCLKVQIFDRPVKDCPLFFEVTEHNSPVLSFGQRGLQDKGFVQPCSLAIDASDTVYVVDTGNSRIKVLSPNLDFQHHVLNESLEGRSVTGVCLGSSGDTLVTVNWRTKTVTEMTFEGRTIGGFSHEEMVEPIAVAVNEDGDVYVADNGVGSVLVFESCGKLKRKIGQKGKKIGNFKEMTSLCICENGDLLVGDSRIIVFDSKTGDFLREISGLTTKEGNRGRYCGLSIDSSGLLLAARVEKSKSYVQLFDRNKDWELHSVIDSHGSKLKRPTGVAVGRSGDGFVFVVDIGHECVRKYRYK